MKLSGVRWSQRSVYCARLKFDNCAETENFLRQRDDVAHLRTIYSALYKCIHYYYYYYGRPLSVAWAKSMLCFANVITRHSLVRAKGEVFVLLYVCLFVCLFVRQRFLDNPRADSRQSSHAGVFWFRMCLLPFWGLAAPGGRKKGQMKFSLLWESMGNFCILAVFWAISQHRLHGSTPNIICVGTMSADVPPPPVVPIGPWGAGGGGVKNSKKIGGWSHSYIGQLPFLFLSAMPNVVQYVRHRPAHILV